MDRGEDLPEARPSREKELIISTSLKNVKKTFDSRLIWHIKSRYFSKSRSSHHTFQKIALPKKSRSEGWTFQKKCSLGQPTFSELNFSKKCLTKKVTFQILDFFKKCSALLYTFKTSTFKTLNLAFKRTISEVKNREVEIFTLNSCLLKSL